MAGRAYLRWRTVRWALLALPIFTAILLYPIDRAYKSTSPGIGGMVPQQATWTIATGHAPEIWAFIEASPEYAAFEEELSKPLIAFEREVHLLTGIRPTPSRWKLWMGDSIAIAKREEAIGFCVRPGVLIRGYHVLRTLLGARAEDGVYAFGGLHYTWHNGFLIVSNDADYFVGEWFACLAELGPVVSMEYQRDRDQISALFGALPGMPVEIEVLRYTKMHGAEPKPVREFPGEPAIVVSAPDPRNLIPLGNRIREWGGQSELVSRLFQSDWGELPEIELPPVGEAEHVHVALYDLEMDSMSFLPSGIVAVEGVEEDEHPVLSVVEGVPFEWEGVPGAMVSRFGNWEDLACASEESMHYTATDELLMTQLMAEPIDLESEKSNIEIRIDWAAVAQILQDAARRLTKDDVESPLDYAEVEADIMPVVRAIAKLGHAELQGNVVESYRLWGTLTSAGESLADVADVGE